MWADTLQESGVEALLNYAQLLGVIVAGMLFVALVSNPLLVYVATRQNPYPLVCTCLRGSAITAFFTRSSAANIPVNLELCRRLKLDPDTYCISIPLGATINMCGAAITITVITLATTHTLGINVDFATALLLCWFQHCGLRFSAYWCSLWYSHAPTVAFPPMPQHACF